MIWQTGWLLSHMTTFYTYHESTPLVVFFATFGKNRLGGASEWGGFEVFESENLLWFFFPIIRFLGIVRELIGRLKHSFI